MGTSVAEEMGTSVAEDYEVFGIVDDMACNLWLQLG
jgi:hypothetical protein